MEKADILQLINTLVTLLVGVLAAAAVIVGRQNHILMNSRLTELLDLTRKSAKAEGAKEERNGQVRRER